MLSHFSRIQLSLGSWAPLSMGFSRQEWNGLSCPPSVDLLDPGIKHYLLCLLHWQEGGGAGGSLPLGPPGKPHANYRCLYCVLRHFSHFWLCAALWTVALSAALSMAFSRQEYWSGLLCPSQGDLPNPGIKPAVSHIFLHWQVGFFFFFFYS